MRYYLDEYGCLCRVTTDGRVQIKSGFSNVWMSPQFKETEDNLLKRGKPLTINFELSIGRVDAYVFRSSVTADKRYYTEVYWPR